jgi:ABC-type antimicrobial peptide transport system permease subunit
MDRVASDLGRALADVGLELMPTTRRLAQFNAVQNTYLGTFQVLGGLGLILGSVGLGVVLLRNVLERRGELALLLAVGYRPSGVRWMVLSEHGSLLLAGLVVGLAAAAVAVVPSIRSAELPYASLGLTLGAVLVSGVFWTWAASRWSLRAELLPALRRE